jgi:hypothetical protein
MAKIQVVNPKNNKAIKPSRRLRISSMAVQVVQLLLQVIVIYLILTK